MTPYYADESVTLYHGDCRDVLPSLGEADHVITDPPYDTETHAGARTAAKQPTQNRARKLGPISAIAIDFAALGDPSWLVNSLEPKRWYLSFCSLEMLGRYRDAAGERWVRGGFWRRPDGAPQFTGDRPGQPGEGIAIWHRSGKKRWNGGGKHGYYEHNTVKHGRVHPTQKPESLMIELVSDFTEPGEIILDPFMGSGTTLAAAKRLGRKAIGIEVDESYCEIAARRLSQGSLAEMFQ